ncbi:hypothetical protein GDO86_008277 [Hymenochirus boettgeri]|uniref:RNA-binding protein NOB1 n=1 Tax=Hymenochirus boettgeri TaxID=247094 RepID=A0A8T2IWX7_9PIPI|nr:hypothetical protein GDO86_008277 [Hymenochirus boettgeri]
MADPRVQHVVTDSGAFLRNATLQDIGINIYTVRDVVSEIRDKETKRRLAVLPYELTFKEPSPENIQRITEFSKKTGDYASLSATDIKVLALTYQLEVEHAGQKHLKEEPSQKVSFSATAQHPEAPVNIAGFHFPSQTVNKKDCSLNVPTDKHSTSSSDIDEFGSFLFWRSPLPSIEDDLLELTNAQLVSVTLEGDKETIPPHLTEDQNNSEEELPEDYSCEEDENDDEGWITPSNFKQIHQDMGMWETPINVLVGCLTTDFAMQNVLIQMGLHVLSVDGMLIRQTRNYILRCHGCFNTLCRHQKVESMPLTHILWQTSIFHSSACPRRLEPRLMYLTQIT